MSPAWLLASSDPASTAGIYALGVAGLGVLSALGTAWLSSRRGPAEAATLAQLGKSDRLDSFDDRLAGLERRIAELERVGLEH